MKKGGFLRNVLDTIRSNQTVQSNQSGTSGVSPSRTSEFGGQLKPHHFALSQVARHGFPENPTALAFDPVQKIAAIGTKDGTLRVFGRPGVDVWTQHKPECAITLIKFVINQGAIITVTADDSIHLWSLRGPNLKLQMSAPSGSTTTTGLSSSLTSSSHSPTSTGAASSAGISSTGTASAQTTSPASIATLSSSQQHNIDLGTHQTDYLGADFAACGSSASSTIRTNDQQQLTNCSRAPEILHSLKFQRERITSIHQTLMSKWLYIGTERGNVHVANVETFELSGYSIPWNKAIELSRKTHPGSIIHISDCPQDANKLLIGYESGCIVLWDLKNRTAEGRYYHSDNLLWLAWHFEGKQFVASHGDGSLVTWQTRSNARPAHVLYPHAKVAANTGQHQSTICAEGEQQQHFSSSPHYLAPSFARALNNELYRPINKVEWKISKASNEQFQLFSGGLPYDGLDSEILNVQAQVSPSAQHHPTSRPASSSSRAASSLGGCSGNGINSQQQQQLIKSASVSPNCATSTSPLSVSMSPSSQSYSDSGNIKSISGQQQLAQASKERKILRSTSLTVMYGKSITVLEMDETIIDFITICDNSPYENDASDPYAVLVLLSNDLILIDLTSSGYPSFESPYPASSLNDSPVTCVQYLADCSSDLIPFLYSTSQNLVSRGPRKGYSDKEWPINGGEWGQPSQSYPELVITGHADGTIKFWDMSGVNFDLITKIKTSKLFERPSKLANSILLTSASHQSGISSLQKQRAPHTKPSNFPQPSASDHSDYSSSSTLNQPELSESCGPDQHTLDDYFAIEQIEYCAKSRHLLVAGALSQVIQFKLNKKDSSATSGGGGSDLSTILVDPLPANGKSGGQVTPAAANSSSSAANGSTSNNEANASNQSQQRHHLLLKAKSFQGPAGSTSSGSSVSSAVASGLRTGRGAASFGSQGFLPHLICLTPLLVQENTINNHQPSPDWSPSAQTVCIAPPKITALALQATHNILAYSHEQGLVLVDTIQKCVIMNAPLNDLYGVSRDISIGATNLPSSSVGSQHHHHQSSGSSTLATDFSALGLASTKGTHNHSQADIRDDSMHGDSPDNGPAESSTTVQSTFSTSGGNESCLVTPNSVSPALSQRQHQSRFTANSIFQRQLSTNALSGAGPSGRPPAGAAPSTPTSSAGRLFQRQLTASQLGGGRHAPALGRGPAQPAGVAESLARSPRREPPLSGASQPGAASEAGQASLAARNKRIISRMLSISAIPTGALSADLQAHHEQLSQCAAGAELADQQQPSSDKIDSSFIRSRSSSSSSNAPSAGHDPLLGPHLQPLADTILCLCFLANCAPKHTDSTNQLALWLGTSHGFVLLLRLQLPDTEDNRVLQLQSVQAEPVPQASIRLPGPILCLRLFQCEAARAPPGGSPGSHSSLEAEHQPPAGSQGPQQPAQAAGSQDSLEARSASFLAVVSAKEARVYQLPGPQRPLASAEPGAEPSGADLAGLLLASAGQQPHPPHQPQQAQHQHHQQPASTNCRPSMGCTPAGPNCVARCELGDSSFACAASLVAWRQPDESCLVSYLANGSLRVLSLPQLRPLMEAHLVSCSSARLARSLCFSRNGHALYRPTQNEILKFSLGAHYKALLADMTGSLYVAREMPEMPRANFFRSLLSAVAPSSASARHSERDELFGEVAGRAGRTVAKHISQLDKLRASSQAGLAHELRAAREGLDERQEKLSELEDRTQQMMNQSESYAQTAHQLAQKFKDKKWYQF